MRLPDRYALQWQMTLSNIQTSVRNRELAISKNSKATVIKTVDSLFQIIPAVRPLDDRPKIRILRLGENYIDQHILMSLMWREEQTIPSYHTNTILTDVRPIDKIDSTCGIRFHIGSSIQFYSLPVTIIFSDWTLYSAGAEPGDYYFKRTVISKAAPIMARYRKLNLAVEAYEKVSKASSEKPTNNYLDDLAQCAAANDFIRATRIKKWFHAPGQWRHVLEKSMRRELVVAGGWIYDLRGSTNEYHKAGVTK
jgi:hypothetical protein